MSYPVGVGSFLVELKGVEEVFYSAQFLDALLFGVLFGGEAEVEEDGVGVHLRGDVKDDADRSLAALFANVVLGFGNEDFILTSGDGANFGKVIQVVVGKDTHFCSPCWLVGLSHHRGRTAKEGGTLGLFGLLELYNDWTRQTENHKVALGG